MRAAWLAGIPVERVRFITYVLCGTLGGINGAPLAGYFRGASIDIGNEYLLASIAVVVIGGTSVTGGRANLPGIWGASLFLDACCSPCSTHSAFPARALAPAASPDLIIVAVITAAGGQRTTR